MSMAAVSRACRDAQLYAGRIVGTTRLCHVRRVSEEGRPFFLKRRRWYAGALIGAARALPAHFRVLGEREWLAFEPEVYRAAYGQHAEELPGRWLKLPGLPGSALDAILRSPKLAPAAKVSAVAAAALALRRLHALLIAYPDGPPRRFSHGDAGAINVLIDAAGQAWWLDFETVHPAGRPSAWRHADDLCALYFSSAAHWPGAPLAALSRAIVGACCTQDVLPELHVLAGEWTHPNTFRLAQAPLSCAASRAAHAALVAALTAKA